MICDKKNKQKKGFDVIEKRDGQVRDREDRKVSFGDDRLLYSGRIDWENPEKPEFIFPASSLTFWFYGNGAVLEVENTPVFWNNYLGAWIDGKEKKWKLNPEGRTRIVLVDAEKEKKKTGHKVLIFKRQDCCHTFALCLLELSEGGFLLEAVEKPVRRMEVYGDSVSAGEVSEALDNVGKPDPEHQGEYSNSWYSYAWIAARKLNAELYDIAQGGIPLLNGTGWVAPPDYPGMEFMWDKLHYHPQLGKVKPWDFSRYQPHLVIIAIGQNDSHPTDVMKEDFYGEKAMFWRKKYREFIENIRRQYPKAVIILTTTILEHHKNWDLAIEEVCEALRREGDGRLFHLMYTRNGCGTPGHLRIPEAEEMAEELVSYIESLDVPVWENE